MRLRRGNGLWQFVSFVRFGHCSYFRPLNSVHMPVAARRMCPSTCLPTYFPTCPPAQARACSDSPTRLKPQGESPSEGCDQARSRRDTSRLLPRSVSSPGTTQRAATGHALPAAHFLAVGKLQGILGLRFRCNRQTHSSHSL